MSAIDNIIEINLTREAQFAQGQTYQIHGIHSEFASDKTTSTFARSREYASLVEMTDDGWLNTDREYLIAKANFDQTANGKPEKIVLGRKDASDSNWGEALDAIQAENPNWYTLNILSSKSATLVFDSDFVTLNAIDATIDGNIIGTVVFDTDQLTTINNLKTQIEADYLGSVATISVTDLTNRTLIVEFPGGITSVSVVVTLGASQPLASILYVNQDDYMEAAAWTQSNTKYFLFAVADKTVLDGGNPSSIAAQLKALNYNRTTTLYHPFAQGEENEQFFESAIVGQVGPTAPGSSNWSNQARLIGITSYVLDTTKQSGAKTNNVGMYLSVGSLSVTRNIRVSSGLSTEIIRGDDSASTDIQIEILNSLANFGNIPMTNPGIAIIETDIKGVMNIYATRGQYQIDTIVVSVPDEADIAPQDRADSILRGILVTATYQGSIDTVVININLDFGG